MRLGDKLQWAGCDVVVTGGPGEDYQSLMIDHMDRLPVFIAAGSVNLREFGAYWLVRIWSSPIRPAPSIWRLLLGVPTVSVYSGIPTCHPARWGPYPTFVEGSGDHVVITAPAAAAGDELESEMAGVSVEQVWRACESRLAGKLTGAGAARS